MRGSVAVRVLVLALGLGAVLGGCGTQDRTLDGAADAAARPGAYGGPLDLPVDHGDDATVPERGGSAARALECAGRPYDGGGGDYDSGLGSVQSSPEAALRDYLRAEPTFWRFPVDGYVVERADEDRVLLSYDVGGRTTMAFVTAAGTRDHTGAEGWGVESWAQCDPAELPPAVSDALGLEVWHRADGSRVPVARVVSRPGAEHCSWQDLTFLSWGAEEGGRQFVRDPGGELADLLATSFAGAAALPENARDTGVRRDGRQLWLARGRPAAYLVAESDPSDVERWPEAREPIGCV